MQLLFLALWCSKLLNEFMHLTHLSVCLFSEHAKNNLAGTSILGLQNCVIVSLNGNKNGVHFRSLLPFSGCLDFAVQIW